MAKEIRGKGKRCHITFRQHTDISGLDVQAAVSQQKEQKSVCSLHFPRQSVGMRDDVSKPSELPT